jgi:hypothetical protein
MIEFPFRSVKTLKRNRSGPLFQAAADPAACRSARKLTERQAAGSNIESTERTLHHHDTWHANWQWEGRQYRKSLRTKNKKEARRKAVLLEGESIRRMAAKRRGRQFSLLQFRPT